MDELKTPFAKWLMEKENRYELIKSVSQETGYKYNDLDRIFINHPTDPNVIIISEKYLNYAALKFIRNNHGVFLYPIGRKYKKVPITKPTYMKQFITPHIRHPYHRRLRKMYGPRVRLPDMKPFVKRYTEDNLQELWSLSWG